MVTHDKADDMSSSNNSISNLNPIVRLDWSSKAVFSGRQAELKLLRGSSWDDEDAISETTTNNNAAATGSAVWALVEAESGQGKSSLVQHAFQHDILGVGKFGQHQTSSPLSVWNEASHSLLKQALKQGREKETGSGNVDDGSFRAFLQSKLQAQPSNHAKKDGQEETSTTSNNRSNNDNNKYLRDLACFINFDESDGSFQRRQQNDSVAATNVKLQQEFGFDRLKWAYRELFRLLAQYFDKSYTTKCNNNNASDSRKRVVFFLDDLQWADRESLAIWQTLLQDPQLQQSTCLKFVGATRPINTSQVDEEHHQQHPLLLLQRTVPTKKIVLPPLTAKDITHFLEQLLKRDAQDLQPLSDIIFHKTFGNAFFVREFLRLLEQKELLFYSAHSFRWEWKDTAHIQTEMDITTNVVDLVSSQMKQQQDPDEVNILSCAAVLGSVYVPFESLLWIYQSSHADNASSPQNSKQDLLRVLNRATQLGFLEKLSSNTNGQEFKFPHDRIRESALMLLPRGKQELAQLKLDYGMRLWELQKQSPDNEQLLFQTVMLLNDGSMLSSSPATAMIASSMAPLRLDMARLNCCAAQVAMRLTSFFPAAKFLRLSFSLLGDHPWRDHFEIAIKVATDLTRMEYCCGNLEKSIEMANEVLRRAPSYKEKVPVAQSKLRCLTQLKRPTEALNTALSLLDDLGVSYPRRFLKLRLVSKFIRAKHLLRKTSDDDLLSLPPSLDERHGMASAIMPLLGELALTFSLDDHVPMVILSSVELSILKGRNAMTPMTLVGFGFLLASEEKFDEAFRFGEIGLKLAKERKGGVLDDRAAILHYTWIMPWRRPYAEGVAPMGETLTKLWEQSDLEHVITNTTDYMRLYFLAGLKLGPLLDDIRQFCDLCSDLAMPATASLHSPFFQMIGNLTVGPQELELSGESMAEAGSGNLSEHGEIGVELHDFHKMVLLYYFNDYVTAGMMADKVTNMFLEGAESLVPYRFFFKGLVAWTVFGMNGKSKFRKMGIQMLQKLERWLAAGVVNCHHTALFLRAEKAACSLKKGQDLEEVRKAYDQAISSCARSGFMNNKALANERAALFCLRNNDESWAKIYFEKALEAYLDWGATAKARQLERNHAQLFSSALHPQLSSGLQSKARLSHFSVQTIKNINMTPAKLHATTATIEAISE